MYCFGSSLVVVLKRRFVFATAAVRAGSVAMTVVGAGAEAGGEVEVVDDGEDVGAMN